MAIPVYESRELIGVMEQRKPVISFLLDTFFKQTKLSATRHIDIDIIKGKRKTAPYVRPMRAGKVVDREGFTTNSFTPPYIKPKAILTAADLGLRLPGETIYAAGQGPDQFASAKVGETLADFENDIVRAEELQAAQGLQTGKVTINGEGYNDFEIDFLMEATHLIGLTGADRWSQTTGNPIADLLTWRNLLLQDSGMFGDTVIMGEAALSYFKQRTYGQGGLFDLAKVNSGAINPAILGPGVVYIGRLIEIGVDVYQYINWYQDSNGVEQPYVNTNNVIMGSTRAKCIRHYGMIEDLEAPAMVKRFAKTWPSKDPSGLNILLQTAPLMAIHQPDAFICGTVHV